jgi:hypothetical protein
VFLLVLNVYAFVVLFIFKRCVTEQVDVEIMLWSFSQGELIQILAGSSAILRFS